MTAKKWLILLISSGTLFLGLPVGAIMGFNMYIDPLWNFDHSNKYNSVQRGFNERQQKTNDITFGDEFDYDNLLIGTSRTTYMNQYHFSEPTYNYGLSAQSFLEYPYYIDYAKKQNGRPFKKIYMEMYLNSFHIGHEITREHPDVHISTTNEPFYRYTSLFSYDTYQKSKKSIEMSTKGEFTGHRAYKRNNVAFTGQDGSEIIKEIEEYEEKMEDRELKEYDYNPNYEDMLKDLIESNPTTEFVPFTEPMPARKLVAMLKIEGYRDGFDKWYHAMVNQFDKVYSFQMISPITENVEGTWFDLTHINHNKADRLIEALEKPEENNEIITVVTKENVDEYLENLFQQVDNYNPKDK
ncbi:hypothetical protein ACTWP4_02900 [Gracilibacillus sp. D59]|uniref:hypothetical protein n=1 Tax=Gracilibacillus sp. D59 TaxID=3457434 RepID=UPI003FCCBC6D